MIGLVSGLSLAHPGVQAPRKTSTKLDALVTQGAVVSRAYSVRQLKSLYSGQCCRLRGNGTGSPEADIPFVSGALDKSAAAAVKTSGSGTAAYWKSWYDQSGNGSDATQTSAAQQTKYGEGVFSTGAMGDAASAQAGCWLEVAWPGYSTPFAIWVVCTFNAATVSRWMTGFSSSSSLGLSESATSRNFAQNWGSTQSSGFGPSGAVNVLGVCNGASSTLWVGGVLKATGNAGSSAPGAGATMRIGCNSLSTQCWFGNANNCIAEVIIFGSDPTSLAGWSDFVADAKNYFGTA